MTRGSVDQKVMDEAEAKTQRGGDRELVKTLSARFHGRKETVTKREQVRKKLIEHKVSKALAKVMKPENGMKTLDRVYQAKYRHYLPGSVHATKEGPKLRCQIRCTKCKAKRDVFTSDLFQVTLCRPCLLRKRATKNKGLNQTNSTARKKEHTENCMDTNDDTSVLKGKCIRSKKGV